jgi:hypothetical protein
MVVDEVMQQSPDSGRRYLVGIWSAFVRPTHETLIYQAAILAERYHGKR